MRTTTAASTDVASGERPPEAYIDALFRDSKGRIVPPPPLPAYALVADTHAHLDMLHNPDLALARCAVHGVGLVVTVIDPTEEPSFTLDNLSGWLSNASSLLDAWLVDGACLPPSPDVQAMRTRAAAGACLPHVRAIIGCHPHNASRYDAETEAMMLEALRDERMRAIGEIGLDYHYDMSPRNTQQAVFARQLELARQAGLPVSLHLREAHADGLAILREAGVHQAGCLLHCFNLDYATLEPFLELGCHVAFGGPVTFKKSDDVRDAASRTPLERIVTETDAPFMAPHPLRGVTCGPEHVVFTAACLLEQFRKAQAGDGAIDGAPAGDGANNGAPALDGSFDGAAVLNQIYANALRFFKA
jgi:TatD DNase family protein